MAVDYYYKYADGTIANSAYKRGPDGLVLTGKDGGYLEEGKMLGTKNAQGGYDPFVINPGTTLGWGQADKEQALKDTQAAQSAAQQSYNASQAQPASGAVFGPSAAAPSVSGGGLLGTAGAPSAQAPAKPAPFAPTPSYKPPDFVPTQAAAPSAFTPTASYKPPEFVPTAGYQPAPYAPQQSTAPAAPAPVEKFSPVPYVAPEAVQAVQAAQIQLGAQQYSPVLNRQVNAAQETIEGRLGNLLRSDGQGTYSHPLVQQATNAAMQRSAGRGLLNSSMAQQAGIDAAIGQSINIAAPDAQTYTNQARANQDASNVFARDEMNYRNEVEKLNAGMLNETNRFNADLSYRNSQLGQNALQFNQQLNQTGQQYSGDLDFRNRQLAQSGDQFDRSFDKDSFQFYQNQMMQGSQFNQKLNQDGSQFNQNLQMQGSQFDGRMNQDASQFNQKINQDASQFNEKLNQDGKQFNQNQQMQGSQFDSEMGLKAKQLEQSDYQFGAQLGQQDRQFNKELGFKGQQLAQQGSQFGSEMGLKQQQLTQSGSEFNKTLDFKYKELDLNKDSQKEARDLAHANALEINNISAVNESYTLYLRRINEVDNDPNLSEEAKVAKKNSMGKDFDMFATAKGIVWDMKLGERFSVATPEAAAANKPGLLSSVPQARGWSDPG